MRRDQKLLFWMFIYIVKAEKIQNLSDNLEEPVLKFTEMDKANIEDFNVFILDTIGYLGRAYSYADIAYVGGAAGSTGLHNILEPATFGIPIIIGSNYDKFPEAARLRQLAGLFSVKNSEEFDEIMDKFISNPNFRKKSGMIAGHFINSSTGATRLLKSYLKAKKE